eukprot:TRINITY_DN1706_c0_g1_i3.p2 TRINITY_DN1706_c0_g1~~TRINITY_DN1706_c0_g1_i3.p2  ORF type:complete len:229 (+),score=25.51 TRINITY_DN1706_c0_g1_i3:44-730(+)
MNNTESHGEISAEKKGLSFKAEMLAIMKNHSQFSKINVSKSETGKDASQNTTRTSNDNITNSTRNSTKLTNSPPLVQTPPILFGAENNNSNYNPSLPTRGYGIPQAPTPPQHNPSSGRSIPTSSHPYVNGTSSPSTTTPPGSSLTISHHSASFYPHYQARGGRARPPNNVPTKLTNSPPLVQTPSHRTRGGRARPPNNVPTKLTNSPPLVQTVLCHFSTRVLCSRILT